MRMSKEFVSAVGGLVLLTGAGCQWLGGVAREAKDGTVNGLASIGAGFNPEDAKYVAQVQRALNEAGCRDKAGRYLANDGRQTVETEQAWKEFLKANGGPNSPVFKDVIRREGISYPTISDEGILGVVQSAGKGPVKGCGPEPSLK